MDLLNQTYRLWALRREFRAVRKELDSYSDRELTDLGLGRADVVRVALEEAERRIDGPVTGAAGNGTRWRGPAVAAHG